MIALVEHVGFFSAESDCWREGKRVGASGTGERQEIPQFMTRR
jgi:hypothetical protein